MRDLPIARLGAVALAAALSVGSAGCPEPIPDPTDMSVRVRDFTIPPPICVDGVDGGPPATLATVERITRESCAVSQCHDGPKDPFEASPHMDLTAGHVRASWVNVAAYETCGGTRVVPGSPDRSYVYHKLTDPSPCNSDAGESQMPRCEVGACPLPDCQIAIIKAWIAAGAPP